MVEKEKILNTNGTTTPGTKTNSDLLIELVNFNVENTLNFEEKKIQNYEEYKNIFKMAFEWNGHLSNKTKEIILNPALINLIWEDSEFEDFETLVSVHLKKFNVEEQNQVIKAFKKSINFFKKNPNIIRKLFKGGITNYYALAYTPYTVIREIWPEIDEYANKTIGSKIHVNHDYSLTESEKNLKILAEYIFGKKNREDLRSYVRQICEANNILEASQGIGLSLFGDNSVTKKFKQKMQHHEKGFGQLYRRFMGKKYTQKKEDLLYFFNKVFKENYNKKSIKNLTFKTNGQNPETRKNEAIKQLKETYKTAFEYELINTNEIKRKPFILNGENVGFVSIYNSIKGSNNKFISNTEEKNSIIEDVYGPQNEKKRKLQAQGVVLQKNIIEISDILILKADDKILANKEYGSPPFYKTIIELHNKITGIKDRAGNNAIMRLSNALFDRPSAEYWKNILKETGWNIETIKTKNLTQLKDGKKSFYPFSGAMSFYKAFSYWAYGEIRKPPKDKKYLLGREIVEALEKDEIKNPPLKKKEKIEKIKCFFRENETLVNYMKGRPRTEKFKIIEKLMCKYEIPHNRKTITEQQDLTDLIKWISDDEELTNIFKRFF